MRLYLLFLIGNGLLLKLYLFSVELDFFLYFSKEYIEFLLLIASYHNSIFKGVVKIYR